MIPVIAQNGTSFKGAFAYYGHDKNASTTERVAFTESVNLRTNDPDKAWRVMMHTALAQDHLKAAAGIKATGRKLETTVFAYSLSWAIGQNPTKEDMIAAGYDSLEALKAAGYQVFMFAHKDEPQPHLHIVINRVHPETGIAFDPEFSKMQLSRWAEKYEREHGQIFCQRRVENNQKRAQGEYVKHCEPVIETAWKQSDNGKSFAAALERGGHILARGDRRGFVVVDPYGKVVNPTRHIRDAKAKDIAARLADLDPAQLPSVDQAKARQAEQAKIRDAQQAAEREDQQLTEEFKRQGEEERKRLLYAAAEAERERIKEAHRDLARDHIQQQDIHQKEATQRRNEAEQAIKDTYRIEEATQQIKAAQAVLKAKGSLWDKITGKEQRQKDIAAREIKELRRSIADGERRAAEYRAHINNLIRQDADKLAKTQKLEREALPPMPERDHSRQAEREQDNPFERSREVKRGRGYEPP
ncbi:MAG: relaxase/mobilization nuclease domain-containing protein [Gallionellaceae bacterium]|jgi:hypothetical protein